jgi:hypothetical protein
LGWDENTFFDLLRKRKLLRKVSRYSRNFVSFSRKFSWKLFAKGGKKILAKRVNCLENCNRNFWNLKKLLQIWNDFLPKFKSVNYCKCLLIVSYFRHHFLAKNENGFYENFLEKKKWKTFVPALVNTKTFWSSLLLEVTKTKILV